MIGQRFIASGSGDEQFTLTAQFVVGSETRVLTPPPWRQSLHRTKSARSLFSTATAQSTLMTCSRRQANERLIDAFAQLSGIGAGRAGRRTLGRGSGVFYGRAVSVRGYRCTGVDLSPKLIAHRVRGNYKDNRFHGPATSKHCRSRRKFRWRAVQRRGPSFSGSFALRRRSLSRTAAGGRVCGLRSEPDESVHVAL